MTITGRGGRRAEIDNPRTSFTLLTTANELWNVVFNNSSENVLGLLIPEHDSYVMVTSPYRGLKFCFGTDRETQGDTVVC